jgi:hypothetical protein
LHGKFGQLCALENLVDIAAEWRTTSSTFGLQEMSPRAPAAGQRQSVQQQFGERGRK